MGRPSWFRRELRQLRERDLLAVPCHTSIRDLAVDTPVGTGRGRPPARPWQSVSLWATSPPETAWTEVNVRDGSKGPIIVPLLKTPVQTRDEKRRASRDDEVLVVIRDRDRDQHTTTTIDYYLSNAAVETTPAEFARAAKAEHRSEECLPRAKSEAGLADDEVRHWIGWQHHQTLSLIATWFLVTETLRRKIITPAITLPQIRWGIARILSRAHHCDIPLRIAHDCQRRLRRNELARLYHWKNR